MYTPLCSSDCPCSSGIVSGSVSQVSCIAFKWLNTVLNNVFGYTEFRPGQLQAMLPALHGKDTVVKMATGAGKSLCMFMVPLAYSDTAVGIIVSPLNSLMDEQVHTILQINIIVELCTVPFSIDHKTLPTWHTCNQSQRVQYQ